MNIEDEYFGSGKILKRAIRKHGVENFTKEILEVYDTETKMNLAERILVITDYEISYNLCPGGQGGFGFINENVLDDKKRKIISQLGNKKKVSLGKDYLTMGACKGIETKDRLYPGWRQVWSRTVDHANFKGKKHSNESKEKMSLKASLRTNERNSQFGTCWITNGTETLKIKKDDITLWLEKGFKRGRK